VTTEEAYEIVRGGDEIWAKTKLIVALRMLSRIVEGGDPITEACQDAGEFLAQLRSHHRINAMFRMEK
jgi:hypothetical protein